MTNDLTNEEQAEIDEKEMLKDEATELGISFSGNIGTATLRKKIADHLEAEASGGGSSNKPAAVNKEAALTTRQRRNKKRKDLMALRRVMVTCLNKNKQENTSQIFTFSSGLTGTLKEAVPFDVPWHIPTAIYNTIRDKNFQTFYTSKDPKSGGETRTGKLVKEFTVQLLDDLSEKEVADLVKAQAMAAAT